MDMAAATGRIGDNNVCQQPWNVTDWVGLGHHRAASVHCGD